MGMMDEIWIYVVVLPLISTPLLLRLYFTTRRSSSHGKTVAILVLGDVGRSPRMMYHAASFVESGYTVYLVGYPGTPILHHLASSPKLHLVHIPEPPKWISNLPKTLFLLAAPLKLILGALYLLATLLFAIPFPQLLMVQTPPALPTLPIVRIAAWIQGSKLVIDWHNTAYSILALRLGSKSPFTRLAQYLEGFFGRKANLHLFVTDAMQDCLSEMWNLSGDKITFHDRPQSSSHRLSATEAHALFTRVTSTLAPLAADGSLPPFSETSTPFTDISGRHSNSARFCHSRPLLLVSSTSWTADEDFSILLDALKRYDAAAGAAASSGPGKELPKIVVIITGKGALKRAFEDEVSILQKGWTHTRCITAWLEAADYPKLLGAADLGISLHSSSSGLDLPMKVVDMFGAGLPVLALDFACIRELVHDGKNGRVFQTAEELSKQIQELAYGFSSDSSELARLRQGVLQTQNTKWQQAWEKTVLPAVQACCTT